MFMRITKYWLVATSQRSVVLKWLLSYWHQKHCEQEGEKIFDLDTLVPFDQFLVHVIELEWQMLDHFSLYGDLNGSTPLVPLHAL